MPRGNRHRVGECVLHITERCHRGEFLLKFARDRRAWVRWLFEARKRFGLCVLDYTVTSNHYRQYSLGKRGWLAFPDSHDRREPVSLQAVGK